MRYSLKHHLYEAWEIPDETIEDMVRKHPFRRIDSNEKIKATIDQRGAGLQSIDAQNRDRQVMKDFNKMLNNTEEGRMVRDDFVNGKIQILHSIEYDGIFSSKSVNWDTPFTDWLSRFTNNRDQISCVAANASHRENPHIHHWYENANAYSVYGGIGFLMKGYPAFISRYDLMSQTLTGLPQGLKDHQKNSGVAKRAGDISAAVKFDEWIGSDEVLLDNWTPIGVYIGYQYHMTDELLKDAINTKLPVYQAASDGKLNYLDESIGSALQ
jgi:hypothetical protein